MFLHGREGGASNRSFSLGKEGIKAGTVSSPRPAVNFALGENDYTSVLNYKRNVAFEAICSLSLEVHGYNRYFTPAWWYSLPPSIWNEMLWWDSDLKDHWLNAVRWIWNFYKTAINWWQRSHYLALLNPPKNKMVSKC